MPSKKALALLALATLGIATWAGYRAECRVMDSAGNKPITFQSVVRRVTAPKSRTEKIDKLNEIRHRAGRSEPSPAEITAAWEIIRALAAEDVKACLEELPMEPERMVNVTLRSMLFFRWGQLDPEAAAETANRDPYRGDFSVLLSTASAWAERDPEAVLRWCQKLGPGGLQNMVANAAGKVFAQQNPAEALEKAISGFPGAVNGVAMALGSQPDMTEEARRAVLARLAGLTDDGKALTYYMQRVARRAAEDAGLQRSFLADAEQAGLSEKQLADLKSGFASYLQRYEPPKVMADGSGVDTALTVQQQQPQYSDWSWREPEKALAWAEQNRRTDLLAGTVKQQSMSLLRSNWQPGVRDERGSPYVKGVIQQYDTWRKLDATAAESWLKTMPADLRKHLSPSADDAAR